VEPRQVTPQVSDLRKSPARPTDLAPTAGRSGPVPDRQPGRSWWFTTTAVCRIGTIPWRFP